MSDDQYRPLPDFRQLEDAVADLARQDIVLAVATDLYRDRYRLAGIIAMLQREGIHEDLVIVAPARGGKLQGGSFLGLPIVEADVARCLVAVGAPPTAPVEAGD
jgi:hypothetical protein